MCSGGQQWWKGVAEWAEMAEGFHLEVTRHRC